jgi:ribosomal protein S18 acetylase RimI-like enzyme
LERCTVTEIEIVQLASENLLNTYFALGLAIPNTTMIQEEGYRACMGEFDHPICNFAARLNLDPWSAKQLRELAAKKKVFNVYSLPTDQPRHVSELLHRCDFRVTYRLVQMVAEPTRSHHGPTMRRSESIEKRLDTATFMTEQFFNRHPETFRARVAHATADAGEMELYELLVYDRRCGAVMLCPGENFVGVYNLCVASENRGVGLGRQITGWALSEAFKRGKLVTLQCDSLLQGWYSDQGFRTTGTIDVYTLSKTATSDIMNAT